MGLITGLLTLPLAPVRGTVWIAERLEEQALAELNDDSDIRTQLVELEELTGYEPEAVTALEWDGDLWQVTVDVLELSRIPSTTDVLGSYIVQLDGDGTLHGYRRARRYVRGQAEGA